ncbi:hypothetical protein HYZ05_01645 [Candidatus Daviesbacteria bacterium]|nr:hypothetical protein [Candidatus Daviesbacteria bacterium]
MQKGSALPFLILVIVILGSLVFFYSYSRTGSRTGTRDEPAKLLQPPVSESKIKTFTGEKLQIQFDYPKQLTAKEDSEEEFNQRGNGDFRKNFTYYVTYPPAEVLGIVALLDETNSYETNPLTVWVFENPNDLTIEQWYQKYWYYPFVWGDFTYSGKFILVPKEEATISGQMGKSGIIDYREGKPKFIYLSKDKKMYLFRIIGESGDKILQNFKFLD